jgi:hypothetical protein
MAIIGFSILGIGDIVGTAIIMSTPGYPNVKSSDQGQMMAGLGVALLSLGIGLALGIPGIMKMSRESEIETRAREHYKPTPASELD